MYSRMHSRELRAFCFLLPEGAFGIGRARKSGKRQVTWSDTRASFSWHSEWASVAHREERAGLQEQELTSARHPRGRRLVMNQAKQGRALAHVDPLEAGIVVLALAAACIHLLVGISLGPPSLRPFPLLFYLQRAWLPRSDHGAECATVASSAARGPLGLHCLYGPDASAVIHPRAQSRAHRVPQHRDRSGARDTPDRGRSPISPRRQGEADRMTRCVWTGASPGIA